MVKKSNAGNNSSSTKEASKSMGEQKSNQLTVAAQQPVDVTQSNVRIESTQNDTTNQNMETENEDRPHQFTIGPEDSTAFDPDNQATKQAQFKNKETFGRNSTGAILNTPSTAETRMVDRNTSKHLENRPSEIVQFKPILEEETNDAALDTKQNYEIDFKTADGAVYNGRVKRIEVEPSKKQKKPKKGKSAENTTTQTVLHGSGRLQLKNGNVIQGEWVDNVISSGTIAFQNGDYYEGEINTNFQPHGYGEMQVDVNGMNYTGTWVNGCITTGTEITKDGQEIYKGLFNKKMKRHGKGECTLPFKQVKFEGVWDNGKPKGKGTYKNLIDGTQEKGPWNLEKFEQLATAQQQIQSSQKDPNFIGKTDLKGQNGILKFAEENESIVVTQEDFEVKQDKLVDESLIFQKAVEDHEKNLDDIRQQYDDDHGVEMIGNIKQYDGEIEDGIIQTQRRRYLKFCKRRQRMEDNNHWEYSKISNELREKPIYATKYSHNLEGNIMNHYQYECKIFLSKDGKSLEITNRKLNTAPTYRKEADPNQIESERKLLNDATQSGKEFVSTIDTMEDDFEWKNSSSTCWLSDIQGIVYGGHSSRFWIYRKHMISLDASNLIKDKEIPNFNPKYPGYKNGQPEGLPRKTSFPFFAWQCITLQFETRNIDLVIKDDKEMSRFIQFIVQGIRTIDGRQGSADFYINSATINEINRLEKKMNKKILKKRENIPCASDEEYEDWLQIKTLSEKQREKILALQKKEIYRQTNFKYTLMRIRSKISYHAFRKHMTVNEFMISGIARSYKQLTEAGEIPVSAPYSPQIWNLFEEILDAPMAKTINGLMQMAHDPVIKRRKEDIYRQKELKLLGVRNPSELDDECQKGLKLLFEKNVGNEHECTYEDCSSYVGKLEKRELIDTGLVFDVKKESQNKQDLFIFTDKSKCMDIYLKTLVDKDKNTQIQMYDQRSYRVLLKYKYNKKVIENKLNKIKFMLGVGELIDIFYIKAVLLKKSLIKQQFVLDVEHQQEVFIPTTLTTDIYPYSFRFYDPIISITNRLFDSKSKMYHCLKTDFFLKKLQGNDFKKKFLEGVGALPSGKMMPLQFQHAQMKQIAMRNIKVTQTKHSISLQKSRYLMVESTEQGLKKLADMQTYVLEKKTDREPGDKQVKVLEDQQLELRFCQQKEVNDKRSRFIIFKQKQFVRHDHLKNQGQKLYTSLLIERYIKENFEELYATRPRNVNYNQEKGIEKNLDLIPFNELTDRQKNMLDRDKVAYNEWLFRQAENEVQDRRRRIRIKSIEECYKECGPTKPFENKNNYIEQKIESTFNYFQILDDVEHLGFETERDRKKKLVDAQSSAPRSEWRQRMDELQEIERIRKKLRIVERLIMKQQARRLAKLDSCVISQMSERNLKNYIAHKGYKTNLKQVSIQNLRDLIEEEQVLKEKMAQRQQRRHTIALLPNCKPQSDGLMNNNQLNMSVDITTPFDSASKRFDHISP